MISAKNIFRIIVVIALIFFNIYLGKIFLSQNNLVFSAQAARLLSMLGIVVPTQLSKIEFRLSPSPEPYAISDDEMIKLVNEERQAGKLSLLQKNEKLEKAAQQLLNIFAQQNYDIENKDYSEDINKILKEIDYQFEV